jgi:hypothetical protein
VTLGTGVGGGVISHGVLLRGARGTGGELGHITVYPAGPRCGCGNRVAACRVGFVPQPLHELHIAAKLSGCLASANKGKIPSAG